MSQRFDLDVQLGTLGGPVLELLPGLEDLRFLATLDTRQKYLEQSNGPYPVARIIDPESLTKPLPGSKLEVGFRDDLNDGQAKLLDSIIALDQTLGFKQQRLYLTFDQRSAVPGKAQRFPNEWHVDNYDIFLANAVNFRRTYIVSSNAPTLYLREQPTRSPELWPMIQTPDDGSQPLFPALSLDRGYLSNSDARLILDFKADSKRCAIAEDFAREKGWLVEAEPFTVYLMPPLVYHRAQIMPDGGPRSFLRVNCG